MRLIELDGISYELPESWNEVKPERLPKLIELVYLIPESGKMHHALLQLALNIKPKAWKKLHQKHFRPTLPDRVRRMNAEVLQQLVSWLSWMWLKPMNQQPFAELQIKGESPLFFRGSSTPESWLLPEPGFKSMSYGELTDLYIHLQAFVEQTVSGDERLDYLVATACRPRRKPVDYATDAGWNGDHREDYNEFIARERVKLVSKLDYRQRMAVMIYVASTIKTIMGQYTLFDTGASPANQEPEAYAGQGFIKNGHLLAEKGIFGNLKQTQQANLHEVLLFLEEHRNDLLIQQANSENRENRQ